MNVPNRARSARDLSERSGTKGKGQSKLNICRIPRLGDIMTQYDPPVNPKWTAGKALHSVILRGECCECTYMIDSSSSDPVQKRKTRTFKKGAYTLIYFCTPKRHIRDLYVLYLVRVFKPNPQSVYCTRCPRLLSHRAPHCSQAGTPRTHLILSVTAEKNMQYDFITVSKKGRYNYNFCVY